MAILIPKRTGSALAITLLCMMSGCGDALTDIDFRGTALWHFSGALERSGAASTQYERVTVSLFWNPDGENPRTPENLIEQRSASQEVVVGAPFILNMFELPDATHIARLPDGRSRGFGIGRIFGYADLDTSGNYSAGDKFVAMLSDVVVFYAVSDLPAWASPTSGSMSAGFHQLLLPQRCDRAVPPPTEPGTCGVTLGQKCSTDNDCGPLGTCLRETNLPWPTGYCTVAETGNNTCRPGVASYYAVPQDIPNPPKVAGWYLKACKSDQDCIKVSERDPGVYHCDPGLFACVPEVGGKMSVGGLRDVATELTRQPFCMKG